MRNGRHLCGKRPKDRWVLSHEYVLSLKVQSSSEKSKVGKIGMNEVVRLQYGSRHV